MSGTRWPRQGQMEMIGLVFVVVVIVVGIVLYVSFSGTTDSTGTVRKVQTYTSFLTSAAETDIPRCGIPLAQVAAECSQHGTSYCGGEPCSALQEAMDTITTETLKEQGIRYNFSLEGTEVSSVDDCVSAGRTAGVYSPTLPVGTGVLRLSICS